MDDLTVVPGLLSVAELVQIIIDRFGALQPRLKMTKERDIREPTSDFVVTLYMEYLRCLKIDPMVTVKNTKKFETPEAYTETLPMISIFSVLRKFFVRHKANDFSMLDLVSPKFKRTYGGIAVIENYLSFYQMCEDELSPKIYAIQEKVDLFREVSETRDMRIDESNKKASARLQRDGKVAELEILISTKKSSVNKLTPIVNEKISQVAEVMSKLQTEKIKSSTLKVGINQLEEELNLQKTLVVPDPSEIEREDKRKKELVHKATSQITDLKVGVENLQKEIQVFEQMMELKSHAGKNIEIARQLKQDLDEMDSQLVNKEGTLEMQSIESKSKRDEFMKKKVIVNRLKENLSSEKAKTDSRLASMEKTIRSLEMERAKVDKKMNVDSTSCKNLLPVIEEQEKQAQQWNDFTNRCESYVVEKKNALDEQVKTQVAGVDKSLHKALATAKAIHTKAAKELRNAEKLLNEQKSRDAAEGRTYKSE